MRGILGIVQEYSSASHENGLCFIDPLTNTSLLHVIYIPTRGLNPHPPGGARTMKTYLKLLTQTDGTPACAAAWHATGTTSETCSSPSAPSTIRKCQKPTELFNKSIICLSIINLINNFSYTCSLPLSQGAKSNQKKYSKWTVTKMYTHYEVGSDGFEPVSFNSQQSSSINNCSVCILQPGWSKLEKWAWIDIFASSKRHKNHTWRFEV